METNLESSSCHPWAYGTPKPHFIGIPLEHSHLMHYQTKLLLLKNCITAFLFMEGFLVVPNKMYPTITETEGGAIQIQLKLMRKESKNVTRLVWPPHTIPFYLTHHVPMVLLWHTNMWSFWSTCLRLNHIYKPLHFWQLPIPNRII